MKSKQNTDSQPKGTFVSRECPQRRHYFCKYVKKIFINMHMVFAAMTHLAEERCLNALLTESKKKLFALQTHEFNKHRYVVWNKVL